jgi:hypothetical protein
VANRFCFEPVDVKSVSCENVRLYLPRCSAMTDEGKPSSLQIPDLVVDPGTRGSAQRSSLDRTRTQGPDALVVGGINPSLRRSLPMVAGGFDLEDSLDHGGADLELLVTPKSSATKDGTESPWPHGTTPDPLSIGNEQVAEVTPYCDPPRHLFETPAYALLVYRDQMRLKREVAMAQMRLAHAERERDELLARWIDLVRPQLAIDERFARIIESLNSEEVRLQGAFEDAAHLSAESANDRQALRESVRELRTRLEASARACAADSEELTRAELGLTREQAKRKRVDIDARAGLDSLDPSTRRLRIATADSAVRAATGQLEQARQRSAMANLAREASALELRQTEDRLAHAERMANEKASAVQEGVKAAETALRRRKADIGRSVLALRDHKFIDGATLEALIRWDAAVLHMATEHQYMMRTMMNGFNRKAVRHGLWLIIVAIALCLSGIVVRILS